MGKTDAKKRLKRIERELKRLATQKNQFVEKIEKLEAKKAELLRIKDINENSLQRGDMDNSELVEACQRVKMALEKLQETTEQLLNAEANTTGHLFTSIDKETVQHPTGMPAPQNSFNTQASTSSNELLELISSPAMLQAAQGLLGDLLKDS